MSKQIDPPFGGYIHWESKPGCQNCHAVIDVNSKFALKPGVPINVKLELTEKGDGHILTITQI